MRRDDLPLQPYEVCVVFARTGEDEGAVVKSLAKLAVCELALYRQETWNNVEYRVCVTDDLVPQRADRALESTDLPPSRQMPYTL